MYSRLFLFLVGKITFQLEKSLETRVEIEPNRAWRYYKKQDFFEYFKKVIKDDVINKKEEYE